MDKIAKIAIPFTQYLMPDGRKRDVSIERPADVSREALALIESGYRFEIEMLPTGQVSMTCEGDEHGDSRDVLAIIVCSNGPGIAANVDALVRQAAAAV